jgi:hypothetical protein
VHRHKKEAHVDAADRAIAMKWVRKQPAGDQRQIRVLLGLQDASDGEEGADLVSDAEESEEDAPPVRASQRKADKMSAAEKKPVSSTVVLQSCELGSDFINLKVGKRRKTVKKEDFQSEDVKSEEE